MTARLPLLVLSTLLAIAAPASALGLRLVDDTLDAGVGAVHGILDFVGADEEIAQSHAAPRVLPQAAPAAGLDPQPAAPAPAPTTTRTAAPSPPALFTVPEALVALGALAWGALAMATSRRAEPGARSLVRGAWAAVLLLGVLVLGAALMLMGVARVTAPGTPVAWIGLYALAWGALLAGGSAVGRSLKPDAGAIAPNAARA